MCELSEHELTLGLSASGRVQIWNDALVGEVYEVQLRADFRSQSQLRTQTKLPTAGKNVLVDVFGDSTGSLEHSGKLLGIFRDLDPKLVCVRHIRSTWPRTCECEASFEDGLISQCRQQRHARIGPNEILHIIGG